MKLKPLNRLLFIIIVTVTFTNINCQVSGRNGYWSTNTGTIRMFVVFAEAVGDPADTYSYPDWPRGQMPVNPGYILDHAFNPSNIQGMVTKVFNQASLGNYTIIGDYYPNLVQLDYNDISFGGESQILDYLSNLPGADITTAHGYTFNGSHFDNWQLPTGYGTLKSTGEDNYIDVLTVFWRVNSKFNSTAFITCSSVSKTVKQKSGFHERTYIRSEDGKGWHILRHEFGHSLMGPNAMHTAGSVVGARVFMSNPGGYSLLNYAWSQGNTYNGYDRYRLGWKNNSNTNYISARNAYTGSEVNTDMIYGQSYPGGTNEFTLRDFITTGDVIRIKLPYLKSESSTVYDQWIWLENRQMKSGNIDLNMTDARGLYAYIQVGKNDLSNFEGLANYLYPLHPFGHYDMEYEKSTLKSANANLVNEFIQFGQLDGEEINTVDKLIINTDKANPFTGYNMIMSMAFNITDPNNINGINYYDEIFRNEIFLPQAVEVNGEMLPSSDFCYQTYACFGSRYDAFTQGRKICIGSNPASTSILTYYTSGNKNDRPRLTRENYDNNNIYLNGLSIEVLTQQANGDLRIRIRWDDFDVNENVRWCGPIVLNEKVYVKTGKTIILDQGLTPTRPVNPMVFGGQKIFAGYTILTCKNTSLFKLEPNSTVELKNNSALVMESGSTIEINDGAVLRVKAGSTLQVQSVSNLVVKGAGSIEVENGGYICIQSGANINLQNGLSVINLRPGYIAGVNANVISNPGTCASNPANYVISGLGSINSQFSQNVYIQNEVITTDRYITGSNIYVGQYVTSSKPYGLVKIRNGSTVIFDATSTISLERGFEVESGSRFEKK